MTDDGPSTSQLERWIRSSATIIAPTTVLSALLFYFGYVSARSQYEYFGIDVDTIGLGTQDYIMRSPQPLLVPLLVLALIGTGCLALHTVTRSRIATAATSLDDGKNPTRPGAARGVLRIRGLARGSIGVGVAVLGTGVLLLFSYAYVRDWALYSLVTPLLIALGAALIAYGTRILDLLPRLPTQTPATATGTEPGSAASGKAPRSDVLRRTTSVLIYVLIAASVFWATATVAQWSGRGLAQNQARNLNDLPSVILDTQERLFLRSPGIEETILPESPGQTFRYRYRHLRLLIHGHDRMFLVPDKWSASNSTLIIALDGSVRVQFQFQNQHP